MSIKDSAKRNERAPLSRHSAVKIYVRKATNEMKAHRQDQITAPC